MINCLFVGIGGFIGSVLRYLIGLVPIKDSGGFPVKTFMINLLGAFLIGVVVSVAARNKNIDPKIVLMLKIGVCGGFTTFSTFAYEMSGLLNGHHIFIGIVYATLSIILGVIAVYLGQAVIR